MNVLIIEDTDEKRNQVVLLLKEIISEVIIDTAMSFRGGVAKLESKAYDLLVLDMVLPIRDGDFPNADAGSNLLSEALYGNNCRRPSHILCLTAYDEVAVSFRDEAERKMVQLILYDEVESKWRSLLGEKARQIATRIKDADSYPREHGIDIAIITSSPMVELQEVLKLPDFSGEFHQDDVLFYYLSNWETSQKRKISVVACAAPSMGMTAACATASKLIERWRPRYLVMTGIAAGTKAEQTSGDILVAEAAFDYGSGKITVTAQGERIFTPSHSQLRIDASLHALLQRWERDQFRTENIWRAWYTNNRAKPPKVFMGLLASGAAVIQDKNLVDEILNTSRKVVGLDMEAFGVFQSAHLATSPSPKVLIAKSVSDFADNQKNDDWQQYAAFTSARFIYEFFTQESALKIGR